MLSADGLCAYCRAQLGRPYWWGTFGQTASPQLLAEKRRQYPGQYGDWDWEKDYGKMVHDCCGLIKGALWCEGPEGKPCYVPSQDQGVRGLYNNCSRKGGMYSMPEEPGVLVFKKSLGHVGVYMGRGKVIEAMGKRWGVVETDLKSRDWAYWGELDWIDYGAAPKPQSRPKPTYYYNLRLGLLKAGMEDRQVQAVQKLLGIDESGIMDEKTVAAVRDFQQKTAILSDGEVGGETWSKLLRG